MPTFLTLFCSGDQWLGDGGAVCCLRRDGGEEKEETLGQGGMGDDEVRGLCTVAHGQDAGSGGFQPVVDLDVAAGGGLDSDEFEADVLGVGHAAGGDQKVRATEDGWSGGLGDVKGDAGS